jgi:saccharopine dehydrogenase (NAD+, L-lysine-forming)
VCAEELAKNAKVSELVLADSRTEAAEAMASRLKSDKISVKKIDATSPKRLKDLLKGSDIVVNSLPWHLLKNAFDTAVGMGVNYVDFSLTVDNIEHFEPARKLCVENGVTAITAMGADPGISDSFAAYAAKKLDEPEEAHVMDGDCGVAEGYEFFSLWSPVDMLEEATVPAAVFRNGKIEYIPPLHEREEYDFPAPIGRLPVYKTNHEETYLMPMFIKGLKKADFRIAIDDNFAAMSKMIRRLGLHSLKPIEVDGCSVKPLKVVASMFPKTTDLAGKVKGYAGVVVDVIGKKKGKRTMVKVWTTMSHEEAYKRCRSNATGYLVGIGGAVGTELLINGDVKGPGIFVPEQLPVEKIISRLPSKGLEVKEETKTL